MRELRRPADVAVMQATDFGNLHDPARLGEFDGPDVRCVLVEREMRASPVIVVEIAGQDTAEVPFSEDEHVTQTLAPDRTDETLGERILPGAVRRREDFLDPHALHSVPKLLTIGLVTVAQEIERRRVVRERVHDLLSRPGGGGMLGEVEMDDPPAVVSEHDEDEENAEASRGHGEEVDRYQVWDMVSEERPPGLRGLGAPLRHEPGDGALGDIDAELPEFPVDAGKHPAGGSPRPFS
jgi:hypothetical protein